MSLEAKRISILKTEIASGVYPLVVSDLKMHKKSNGDLILHEGNPAVIVSFKHEDKIHQEIYWIGSTNYTKLQKIILQVGLNPNEQISKKDIVGKSVLGLITAIHHMRGKELMRIEYKLSETAEIDSKHKFKNDLITYKEEGF